MRWGYARVSTEEQNLEAQVAELKRAGCDRVVEEKESAKSIAGRPRLTSLLGMLQQDDELVVCKLDRLSRNTLEMLQLIAELGETGIGVRSLAEPWADTTSPAGKLMLHVFAGVAEFERGRMLERQKAGIERARAEGKFTGRKPTVNRETVIGLKKAGYGATAIAKQLYISRQTVYAIFREMQPEPRVDEAANPST